MTVTTSTAEDTGALDIDAVAERTGLTPEALRHYDDFGLASPTDRSPEGTRLYPQAEVRRILLIRRLEPLDLPLDEMCELLDAVDALIARLDRRVDSRTPRDVAT